MKFRPLAYVLAAALSVTTTAAPASSANNDALAKVIAGALFLGIVASAANANRKDHDDDDRHRHSYQPPNRGHYTPPHQQPRPQYQPHSNYRKPTHTRRDEPRRPTVHVTRSLPASCARTVRTQYGQRTFLGRPCLERAGYKTAGLPDICHRELDFRRRDVNAWNLSCLQQRGYALRR